MRKQRGKLIMMNKTVLITGITGQVGSYQADLQLQGGNKVIGLIRRTSTPNYRNIGHLLENPNLELVVGDLLDPSGIAHLFNKYQIDECYHYAAQSFVATSFSGPQSTIEINILGTLNILEAIRHFSNFTKMFFAGSSEMFGASMGDLQTDGVFRQTENTQFLPNSPYAISKVAGHQLVRNYRDSYGLFVCSGITFNTESPRRGIEFVTRKITNYVANFAKSPNKIFPKLQLGNLNAKRDWGFALDCAKAAQCMLGLPSAQDFVIATGQTHSISYFLDLAFKHVGIEDWQPYVEVSSKFFRPSEVNYLCGDASKLREVTRWKPSVSLDGLVSMMVDSDIKGTYA